MRNAYAVSDVRVAERALMARVPDGALMQRAAAGLASACARLLGQVYGSRVVVLAGAGDNGGDALFAGARLARRGAIVTAVPADRGLHEAGAAALRGSGGRLAEATGQAAGEAIAAADLIIDGILGIGGGGGGGGRAAPLAPRPGRAARGAGRVRGAGAPRRGGGPAPESDKYRRGVLGVLAGSQRYTGAAVLSVGGAIRGGAGMVRLVSARAAADVVRQHWPEAVVTVVDPDDPAGQAAVKAAGRVQAWAAGPGLGTGDDAAAMLPTRLASPVPLLVHASRLTGPARNKDLPPCREPAAP